MKSISEFLGRSMVAVVAIATNRLTIVLIAVSLLYWTASYLISGSALIEAMSLLAMTIYAAVAIFWLGPALRVLREGKANGVAQLLVGVVFSASAFVALRLWSLVWRWTGYPDWMVQSPMLGYILLLAACSAAMKITSPGADVEGVPSHNWKWLACAIGIAGVLVGFVLGTAAGGRVEAPAAAFMSSTAPRCAADRPFWGNQNSMIYHGPGSVYRDLMKPDACFSTGSEAEAAGFRRSR